MDVILKSSQLTKNYFRKKALNGLDLEIKSGRIVGLLGPNGSGKTTFLKIAAGILKQSSGEILINGNKPGVITKSEVSYLPDKDYLFKWMKIKDAFNFFNDMYKDFNYDKALQLLKFMNLDINSKVKSLSKGMSEKLYLTLVLSRNAKLYILDEPLGGVDPTTRERILDAILDNYSKDSSILITTHLVSDIERLFDDVDFISEGKIILSGDAEELRSRRGKSVDEIYREVFK
ncbi:ATP-binding cassette domain-containing protein [Clostridium tyrobutyricum]|jgi:ABC-2 type transport system ATP-binding protein|uniref:ABC-type multidrug transport system, ATPase component n=2 Tax=Clostridium tyrobutyricum TaxID=1519 RepID=W6N8D5_CLOTY|nr:ABC transporter ATP-binding protein [Clostridium tyrobutyricum]AND84596.1 ABC transporter ATP-binding protein [Clostridium tyrobutyricum]ANP69202.1 multidrug ABC transporter ATP-binding protein [Clostridium tyrobutyricum]MBV4415581.1 ABC transporter ATP-binding protein [Clostridium tyrobutyricum]MBV4421338.1 ABC transporter ATP-binding protein [Clostridium tyrobutyricum]MBV4425054.1 ABC transporter ATP-binding protein [Clostridium tyrobutyricum]